MSVAHGQLLHEGDSVTKEQFEALKRDSKIETPLGAVVHVTDVSVTNPRTVQLNIDRTVITARQVVGNDRWKVIKEEE